MCHSALDAGNGDIQFYGYETFGGVVLDRAAQLLERDAGEWAGSGSCAQSDPEEFFPEAGETSLLAVRICGRCEVRESCLEYAMEHSEVLGIWGGLTRRQRIKLSRLRASRERSRGAAMRNGARRPRAIEIVVTAMDGAGRHTVVDCR
ncbi:WhiB family transcriptional regulator [Nocardia brasiliensis]|uniref:WhiB family transcriptional regulator n=1 Tax=Nocardia brasiliensis TaxID=37326 RepID=UPI003D7A3447